MIIIFFFVSVVLSCLPLLHSATQGVSICPESFSCPGFSPFNFPFYNATESQCGLIKVNCTSPGGGDIQIGEMSYKIADKNDFGSSVSIYNTTFKQLVDAQSCEALMDNFTSPNPLLYSISIAPFITLFKCSKNISYAQHMDTYFHQLNYTVHNKCKDQNFYYQYVINNATAPNDLPHTCQVIRLPVKEPWHVYNKGPDVTNISSLLTPYFSVSFQLSPSCDKCTKKGGHCDTHNNLFRCLHLKKGIYSFLFPSSSFLSFLRILGTPELIHRISPRNYFLALKSFYLFFALVLVGSALVLLLCPVIFIILRCKSINLEDGSCFFGWRKMTKYDVNLETFLKDHEFLAPKRYSYSHVQKMTNSFEVKLGQGGFGSVYKGSLSNGSLVAVKVLSELKGNGEDFINEVASVSRTSHVNIVSLVGFCLEGHRRALIFEFMPNGSLEKFIYERNSASRFQLGWEKLYEIAIGIARGLEYLHRGCNTRILHFDIKPHNILLDTDFCPKISDFGLAKRFPENRSMISMSNMRGTPGYIAPELFSRMFGQVSHKSDVYSYGMMILEMVGGRRNIDVEVDHTSEIYFPLWIYKKFELDEEQLGLHGIVSDEENEMARKMIIVGLWCIQTNPQSRPTITKVLEMLEANLASLEIPPKPYLCSPSRSVDHESTKDY